jgi:hypothetical protein
MGMGGGAMQLLSPSVCFFSKIFTSFFFVLFSGMQICRKYSS